MLTKEEIIHQIDQYSPEDRVRIVETVLNGVVKPDRDVEKVWLDVAAERWEQYKSGKTKTRSYDQVMSKYRS
ncbi:MAG: addiction module protein [Kiritimatiellae bacterium]|nr:addiction module protein [Kiritimatiellia bacterium]